MASKKANQPYVPEKRRGRLGPLLIILLIILLAAFGFYALRGSPALSSITSGGGNAGNPIPTPRPAIDVGSGARSAAQDTPEGTWERYRQDIIAEQVARQEARLSLFERYQDPDITVQNLGGMVEDIDLVEDRTAFNVGPLDTVASTNAEFDIRITFTNGDTDTRTCRFPISLQLNQEDEVWYVVNPDALAVFVVCG